MPAPTPELQTALAEVLDKIDAVLRSNPAAVGSPLTMYLAGGLAVNYHCGSRYTGDIDASFSHRVLLPNEELAANYTRANGEKSFIYFDANYNPAFALMHPDYQQDSVEWEGIGNERRLVQLRVLSPIDLAVSKVSRFSEQDREDILELARVGLVTASDLRARAAEALEYYVGNMTTVRRNLDDIVREVAAIRPKEKCDPPDI